MSNMSVHTRNFDYRRLSLMIQIMTFIILKLHFISRKELSFYTPLSVDNENPVA